MKLSNLKDLVMRILKDNPGTRNSDKLLYNQVCVEMGVDTHRITVWDFFHDPKMPSTESVRRAAVLNLDDDQKLDEYLRKYGVVFENEAQFEYLKHCARVNTKGVFPKLKRESKLWLKEYRRK